MAYYVYILESECDNSYYIGYTEDLQLRLQRHNDGWSRSTKAKRPWKIVYYEKYQSKTEALRREREIKSKKSRRYIKQLIHAGGRPD